MQLNNMLWNGISGETDTCCNNKLVSRIYSQ